MKPVAIIQHEADVGAGQFEHFLRDSGLPYETFRIDRSDAIPLSAERFSGICSLGGSMSVNDPLSWIDDELALLRDAEQRKRPVIGHCLGGQMLARAFGAPVRRSAAIEIGWGNVEPVDRELAQQWLGIASGAIEVFQWHQDAFDLPASARLLLTNPLAAHQAYVVERAGYAHLGMQFHIEMTAQMIMDWARDPDGARMIDEARSRGEAAVQEVDQMLSDLPTRVDRMRGVAERLYARWAQGLNRE